MAESAVKGLTVDTIWFNVNKKEERASIDTCGASKKTKNWLYSFYLFF